MTSFTGDLARMGRERRERMVSGFAEADAEVLLLLGQANVRYATGAGVLHTDAAGTTLERAVAVLRAGEGFPHLFTPWPEGVPAGYPTGHVHPPLDLESPAGTVAGLDRLAEVVGVTPGAGGRWLVDEVPGTLFAVLARSFEEGTIADATPLCATARRLKTADEVACIAHAQAVTESAMVAVHRLVSSGRRGSELSATLLAEALSNGAEACVVDPIWQVMSPSAADGPRTLSGGPAFPLAATGDRALAEGDVIWNDTGFSFGGYHSDFGRTWIVDARPGARQRDQFRRWRDVVAAASAQLRPGSSAHDVTEAADEVGAAGAGSRPWLEHLYLGHGIGMDSAETPLIGTDLGSDFDRRIEIEAGMVVVLEPAIWDEGAGGFRGEEIFAVQPEGDPLRLSHFHYEPFE